MVSTTSAPRPSARERLLAAADELFYREGVHSVGIDRVIEHAGVAKASLYNTFGSKEELVHAYLLRRQASTIERISAAVARCDGPRGKVLAVFEGQATLMAAPGFRGCAFTSASAEAKPGGLVEEATRDYRAWFLALFTDLATQLGARDPELLARQLYLVYDGTAASGKLDHAPVAARAARSAVEALLDAAVD
jgi:AcrR family transcriptional regulator